MMSTNLKRFTVGFEPPVMLAIGYVIANTHFKTMPDALRAAVTVFVDLLSAEDQHMQIVLRDTAGDEWAYSPHKPGRATALPTTSQRDALVLRPDYSEAGDKLSSVNRFTVGFEVPALEAINSVIENTHFKTMPDVLRAAVVVFVDLLHSEDKHMQIILRDAGGDEWKYSPHKPGRATPMPSTLKTAAVVLRPEFGRTKDGGARRLGVVAGGVDTAKDSNNTDGASPPAKKTVGI